MSDPQYTDENHVVVQLREGRSSPALMAAVLLRISDSVLLKQFDALMLQCHAADFSLGGEFLTLRLSALDAVRDAHGLLPGQICEALETYRETLSRVSSGTCWSAG